ncbi:MAG: CpsD/CapB family tyrosine-protein kinase, partial [Acidobacteriota bacterium]
MRTKNFEIYDPENTVVRDAYAMLTANVHFSSDRSSIKTLAICSCLPRVGKTTIAINLAISMARSGWETMLIDGDLRKPGDHKRLNSEDMPGLSEVIAGNALLHDVLSFTNIPNLTYLSCGSKIQEPVELLCSAGFERLIAIVKETFDFIVVDTPALSSVIDGALIAAETDAVILVAQPGKTQLASLNRAKEQLENANANILGVVMNQVEKRDYARYFESYNYFKKFNSK